MDILAGTFRFLWLDLSGETFFFEDRASDLAFGVAAVFAPGFGLALAAVALAFGLADALGLFPLAALGADLGLLFALAADAGAAWGASSCSASLLSLLLLLPSLLLSLLLQSSGTVAAAASGCALPVAVMTFASVAGAACRVWHRADGAFVDAASCAWSSCVGASASAGAAGCVGLVSGGATCCVVPCSVGATIGLSGFASFDGSVSVGATCCVAPCSAGAAGCVGHVFGGATCCVVPCSVGATIGLSGFASFDGSVSVGATCCVAPCSAGAAGCVGHVFGGATCCVAPCSVGATLVLSGSGCGSSDGFVSAGTACCVWYACVGASVGAACRVLLLPRSVDASSGAAAAGSLFVLFGGAAGVVAFALAAWAAHSTKSLMSSRGSPSSEQKT